MKKFVPVFILLLLVIATSAHAGFFIGGQSAVAETWNYGADGTGSGSDIGNSNNRTIAGNMITPSSTYYITKVMFEVDDLIGSPNNYTWVMEAWTVDVSEDLDTLQGTTGSETLVADTWIEFTFSGTITLTSAQRYAFILCRDDKGYDASNYIEGHFDDATPYWDSGEQTNGALWRGNLTQSADWETSGWNMAIYGYGW